MGLVVLIVALLAGFCTLFMLIEFLLYFTSNWIFLKKCSKETGTIARWVPISDSSSVQASWWKSGSDWVPIVEYYDTIVGAVQNHAAVLPRRSKLNQYTYTGTVDIEYYGRHVRIVDERFVDVNIYSGYYFFVYFAISLIVCALSSAVYLML